MGKDNTGTILLIGGLAAAYFLIIKPSQAAAAEGGGGGVLPDLSGLGGSLNAGLDSLVGQEGLGGLGGDIVNLIPNTIGSLGDLFAGAFKGLADILAGTGAGMGNIFAGSTGLLAGLADIIRGSGEAVATSTLGAGAGVATAATGLGAGIQQLGQGATQLALAYGGYKLAQSFLPAAGRAAGLVTTKIAGAVPTITARVAGPTAARVGLSRLAMPISGSTLGLLGAGAAAVGAWSWAGYEIYKHRKELALVPGAIANKITKGEWFPVAKPSPKTEQVLSKYGLTTASVQTMLKQGMTPLEIAKKYGLGK